MGEQDVALAKSTTYGTEDQVAQLTLRYLPEALTGFSRTIRRR